MSLALPPVALSPTPFISWPFKGLALVLAAVLGLHWWLLSGAPLQTLWGFSDTPQEVAVVAMQTRVLPPVTPSVQPRPAEPAPVRTAAKPTHLPAGAAQDTSMPFSPPAPVDIAPAAPELIAKPVLSPPAAEAPTVTTAAVSPVQESPQRYAFPPPVRLNYDLDALTGGRRDTGGAKLIWTHDGTSYQANLIATKFYVNLRQWTSKGALTDAGLAPLRFGDKGRGSEVAAHFVRDEGKVIFSANTPEAPLLRGAQDHLSVFMQLASLWAGEPQRYAAGDSLAFQSIGPRQSETWTFVVSAEENITVPGGTFSAVKLTREPTGDYSTKAELWLAPKLAYLPAHIRLTESNGNVLDMVWTDSEQP
ncbi:DUF3108 domain-containing protein [Rhodoferax saidenbachensis]|uniref:DUF3108 domain-containing protein n=1 Tax=Rhodoferax saidenbachensis TaxID=1484693 RepID=A0ABU1ZPF5_9BURK|nr:DUF3108 domain-containing protein [Rhodoferax saidenbachensis]MDR7306760.1 hypothetical protein [Rhodoferax saidenbachensis]